LSGSWTARGICSRVLATPNPPAIAALYADKQITQRARTSTSTTISPRKAHRLDGSTLTNPASNRLPVDQLPERCGTFFRSAFWDYLVRERPPTPICCQQIVR